MRSDPQPHAADYSRGEEIANTITAGMGLVAALVACPFFLMKAAQSQDARLLPAVVVFFASLAMLYGSSTLYHASLPGPTKHRVRLLDHSAIFLLIAGTYTPFALGPLRADSGLLLLLLEWLMAALGIVFKLWGGFTRRRLSNAIYLGMGWLGILWVRPFIHHVTLEGFLWVLAGGAAYTVGTAFYAAKQKAYMHFIWHLFVFAGTCLHGYAIWRFVL